MTKLEDALNRFNGALDQLERAVDNSAIRSKDVEAAQREIHALKEDRSRLAEELDTLRADRRALENITDEVADRLDGAIAGLRRVLSV